MVNWFKKQHRQRITKKHQQQNNETLKTEVRQHYLNLRNKQNQILRYIRSLIICRRLWKLAQVNNSKVIAVYLALEKEVDLTSLIKKAWHHQKIIVVPRIEKDQLKFHQIENFNFPFSFWKGLKMPNKKLPLYHLNEIDSIIVPGVAFDKKATRIGMGIGFYDRYLADAETTTIIGAAFNLSISKLNLPKEDHDITMDCVVTESLLIARK